MLKLKLHWQILIALALAVPAGILFGKEGMGSVEPLADFTGAFAFVGQFFLNALKMLIVPLIVSAIITGIANLGSEGGFARLGLKTVGYYTVTSLFAILAGLLLVNLFSPGIVDGVPARDLIGLTQLPEGKMATISGKGAGDIVDVFLRMVPSNIVSAAAEGKLLGLITFSLLFGFFMTRLPEGQLKTMKSFWDGVYEVMMKMTDLVMKLAPVGVFGLVAKTVGTTGFDAMKPLAVFFFTVLTALALHMFFVMPLLLRFVGRVSPLAHFRAMSSALLTAFSTSSSSATLPKTMECVQKNAGVSKKISSFTLPLGATVNMDGTALYECVAAMFIAQAYGMELTFVTQFTIVWVALLTSIGVAGIPSASLVAIVLILGVIGLPAEAIGLILVTDRILDMCRTAVNVFSDSCAAVLIARSEGEKIKLAGS